MSNTNFTCTGNNCVWNVTSTDIDNCVDGTSFAEFLVGVNGFPVERSDEVVGQLTSWCNDCWDEIQNYSDTGVCINGTWTGNFTCSPIKAPINA